MTLVQITHYTSPNNTDPPKWIYTEYTALKIFYRSGFLSNLRLFLKFSLYWIYSFYHPRFLSNLRLPWIHCIDYIFLSFRIFEQLTLALKFRVTLKFFTVLNIYVFYHSRFLSNLRLPWKTLCPENFQASGAATPRLVCLWGLPYLQRQNSWQC